MEETFADDVVVLERIIKELRRLVKGGRVVVVAEKEDEDAKAAPARLMNFNLQWLTELKPPDQLIDPSLLVM